jgi:fatty acid desaturase
VNIPKQDLVSEQGTTWAEFRASLSPNWVRVAVDIALAYVAMIATGCLLVYAVARIPTFSAVPIFLAAVSFGYWMANLQLFIHEAAHFNLAPDRTWNDSLANCFVGSWVGTRIASYRAIHWQHHRLHGSVGDTEHSYFSALNLRFLIEALTGVRALKVVLFRDRKLADNRGSASQAAENKWGMLMAAVLLHVLLISGAAVSGYWQLALAWILGMGVFFPFFGALRQLLEHRSQDACASVDYSKTDHGQTTRMFKEGLIGSTFGGAGFSRHGLHHWDPSISYTNLAAVERFLASCEPTRDISEQKTTYLRAFLALYGR